MKATVFSIPAAFVRKQRIKDLRAKDVSSYADKAWFSILTCKT